MNGEVVTYNLRDPISFEIFKSWPTNIQGEYIKRLQRDFNATDGAIAEMFSVTAQCFATYRRFAKVPAMSKGARLKTEEWNRWLKGETEPDENTEKDYNAPMKTDEDVAKKPNGVKVDRLQITMRVDNWSDIFEVLQRFDISESPSGDSAGREVTVVIE